MKNIYISLMVLLLAGCAYTPAELQKQPPNFNATSNFTPNETAKCIARGVDDVDPAFASSVREGLKQGDYEVIARINNDAPTTAAMFLISPMNTGSKIVVHVSPSVITSKEHFVNSMTKNCMKI